jgi:hypothetical protein
MKLFFVNSFMVCTAGFAWAEDAQIQAFHGIEGMPMTHGL